MLTRFGNETPGDKEIEHVAELFDRQRPELGTQT